MGRVLKFRAWVPRLGKFYRWGIGDIDGSGAFFTGPPSEPAAIHQQFTGLLDKNGKEIYEGDILFDGEDCYDTVVYEGNKFILQPLGDDCVYWEKSEVIGNIYENRDLIA